MYPELAGKHVIVTGASRGIGYAVAQALCQAKARVLILVETNEIEAAAKSLSELCGSPVVPLLCDITDRLRLRDVIAAQGPLDVVIANAGTGDITSIDGPDPAIAMVFEHLIRVNLFGAYNTVRATLPAFEAV
jgi:3-hydroxybutyrate dehydrogenase